ncbi:MAG: diguanylate cyclase [Kutzneria sp.]|nr:diguanylate cyclase [Kutzneria sp.]MBV9847229.1 diguanylate cyclase [Kutzneria sp.]
MTSTDTRATARKLAEPRERYVPPSPESIPVQTSRASRCHTCGHPTGAYGTDRLTGLLDRWRWDDSANDLLRHASLHGDSPALLLMDIDSFKRVNDEYGHLAGDTVLKAVAGVLRATMGQADLVGRYGGHGGDEFLVLLADCADPDRVARRIQEGVRALSLTTRATSGAWVTLTGITVSVGCAMPQPTDGPALDDLILRADRALQLAKGERYHRPSSGGPEGASAFGVGPGPSPASRRRARPAAGGPVAPVEEIARDVVRARLLSVGHLLNGDWILDIVLALASGSRRVKELLDMIRSSEAADARTGRDYPMSPHDLIEALRRMEDNGLVLRREDLAAWPRSVSYELSPATHDLLAVLSSHSLWAERHKDLIGLTQRRAAREHPSTVGNR